MTKSKDQKTKKPRTWNEAIVEASNTYDGTNYVYDGADDTIMTESEMLKKFTAQEKYEMLKKVANNQEKKEFRDIAIAAGYSKDSAHQRAYENTTYKLKPHVVKYIEDLKEDFRVRNQITPEKHMARLNEIHQMAKDKGQLHTAMNAEVYRGKVAGYYVEKQLIKQEETEEDVEQKLKEILERYDLLTSHEEENDKRK